MDNPPLAYVCHRCPGRARLKVAVRRNDAAWFEELSARIAEAPQVIAVKSNALTASLLIFHRGALEDVLDYAVSKQVLSLSEAPVFARSQFAEPDEISVRSLATLAMLGLGVVQLLRGRALGPASGLFALAWSLSQHRAGGDPPVGNGIG